jgi:hypothetical protein
MSHRAALPFFLSTLLVASPLLAKAPSLAVITEDLSGELGDGGIGFKGSGINY